MQCGRWDHEGILLQTQAWEVCVCVSAFYEPSNHRVNDKLQPASSLSGIRAHVPWPTPVLHIVTKSCFLAFEVEVEGMVVEWVGCAGGTAGFGVQMRALRIYQVAGNALRATCLARKRTAVIRFFGRHSPASTAADEVRALGCRVGKAKCSLRVSLL